MIKGHESHRVKRCTTLENMDPVCRPITINVWPAESPRKHVVNRKTTRRITVSNSLQLTGLRFERRTFYVGGTTQVPLETELNFAKNASHNVFDRTNKPCHPFTFAASDATWARASARARHRRIISHHARRLHHKAKTNASSPCPDKTM